MRKLYGCLVFLVAMIVLSAACSTEEQFDYPMDTLCGTWETVALKFDDDENWCDITSPIFDDLKMSITFCSDGTYYGRGYFGNGSGTYKAFGKTIETYVNGELYFTYHINYMNENMAELTMSSTGSSIEIRVVKK